MTPDERRMIEDLFQRLADNGGALDKDPQADRLINDLMRRNPDAAYMLAQTAIVYEYQMGEQQNRIAELEDEIAGLRRGSQGPGVSGGAGAGSFLGGRIGSNRGGYEPDTRSAGAGMADRGMIGSQRSGSVPPVGASDRSASPWGSTSGGPAANQSRAQSPGYMGPDQRAERGGMLGGARGPMPPPGQQPPQGGGFLRSALATAAGVAGGMMLANSLGGLFGGNEAKAAGDNSAAMQDADRTQDELQDAQFEADQQQDAAQDADFDQGFDGGGFDSFET